MRINRRTLITSLASLWVTPYLTACSPATQKYTAQIPVFGTLVDIVLYAQTPQQANQAIQAVEQTFYNFHREWHAWEKGGIISKINHAIASQTPITVADSVKDFIQDSQQLCLQSNRLFDPGIGKLIALWGFHSESWQGPPPSDSAIQNWLKQRPSILDIHFQGNQLIANNPDVQLDFGGNAKGLALDIALRSLQQQNIHHALVSIGGDMKSLGLKPNNHSWQVAIQNPKAPEKVITSFPLKANESAVTSGTYQRYFSWQDTNYSHLINPNTGWPVEKTKSFVSVTVVHNNATLADAAATALLIAGPSQWQKIAQKMGVEIALAIDAQNKISSLAGIESRMH